MGKVGRAVFLGLANALSGTRFFALKRTLLRCAGFEVGDETRIVGPVLIGSVAHLSIGPGCWIGHHLSVEGNGSVAIGSNVDIAPWCIFATRGHEIGSSERRAGRGVTVSQTVQDGCWIGVRSTIVNGVHLGAGCVVAAGAVVVDDVPSNTLIGGVPAKVIRRLDGGGDHA